MTKRTRLLLAILAIIVVLGLLPLLAQQPAEVGPPQFTTIPIHNRMLPAELKNGHIVYIPPRAGEMVDADRKPGNGGGGGKPGNGGGHGGGGATDFGQPGAVKITGTAANCFGNSPNNYDATCAKDSYQGETMVIADPSGTLIGSENDIYPGNCSSSAADGSFGDCGLSATISTDGQSWARYKLSRNWGGHNFLIGFDPSAAVDYSGNYFVAYGVSDSSGPNGIVVVSSADGGSTWTKTNPVVLNLKGSNFEDKYWIAADHYGGSQYTDNLYVAWDRNSGNNQILEVATSADHGKTWSSPVKINDGRSKFERVIYAFPAVAPDHTLYVLWHDYAADTIYIDKSSNGGSSWGKDVAIAKGNFGFGTDIGCNGGRSMTPAPQMAIDSHGNIYVVFAKMASGSGNGLDVFLTMSSDRAAHWSTPVRVSDVSTGHQYNPSVFVDASDRINITYLDRRLDSANCFTNTYLSRWTYSGSLLSKIGSDDLVSDAASDFDGNPNGPGDYQSVTSLNSTSYPYFPDHRSANTTGDNNSATIDGGFEVYSAVKP